MKCSICGKDDFFYYKVNGYNLCTECAEKTVSQLYNESDIVEMVSEIAAEKLPEVIGYRDAVGAKKFHLVLDTLDYEKTMSRLMRGNTFIDFQCAIDEIPDGYDNEELIHADSAVVVEEKCDDDFLATNPDSQEIIDAEKAAQEESDKKRFTVQS